MSDGIRLAIVVSDLHAGSTCGLHPPDFETGEGQHIGQNHVQRWLWRCWVEAWIWADELIGDSPWALILNGDLVDGDHHHNLQIIRDPSDHRKAAEEILIPRAEKASAVFLTQGTECHTGNQEDKIAVRLGATPPPDSSRATWEKLDLTIAGVRCVFFHHIGATSREHLRASALGITLANEQTAAARNGEVIPRVLGCAHRHTYNRFDIEQSLCFTTPAWQAGTRFVGKAAPSGLGRTKPGLVAMDWRDRENGELPDVKARTFAPAPAKGVILS